jgi:hypothetical protein
MGEKEDFLIATYLALINVSADPPEATHLSNFHFFIINSVLTEISIAHNLPSQYVRREVRRLSLLLGLPAGSSLPECVCLFLFMIQQTAETVGRERISEECYFLMQW